MRHDDEHLAELLRALPPPPAHLLEAVKELPLHFPDEAAAVDVDDGDDDDGTSGHDTTADHHTSIDDDTMFDDGSAGHGGHEGHDGHDAGDDDSPQHHDF